MKNKRLQFLKFVLFLGFCAFLIFTANAANAATLYFSPSSGNFSVGDILDVSVLVNTQGQEINNADALINFPTGLLDIISVNKSGSVFSLWVEEPAFSNSAGTITFNGGLPTPGFNGAAGKIVNVVFRVRSEGTASLFFSSATVRANDGYGTNILQTREQAQFNLISEERPAITPPIILGTPQAPNIYSPTHPDSNKWYAKKTATFTWPISADVTAVKLLVGKIPVANPIVLYIPPLSSKTVDNFKDGVWYFHANLKNSSGWGKTNHFRFNIDTTKPDKFDIRVVDREDPTDLRVRFVFDAHDEMSGIDHYNIQINSEDYSEWRYIDGNSIFETPALNSGAHIITVDAVDKAGNALTNSVEFEIEPLEAPIITQYPREIESGEILIVKGTTYPNADIVIWLQKNDKAPDTYSVKSDKDGSFIFINEDRLAADVYNLQAEVTDNRGAKSLLSEKVKFVVKQSTFLGMGAFTIGLISALIFLLVLTIFLIFMLLYGRRKLENLKSRARKEANEASQKLHKAFGLLKEDIHKKINLLKKTKTKRQLIEEESKIVKGFKNNLDDAEKFIKKEIKDIEKEVK